MKKNKKIYLWIVNILCLLSLTIYMICGCGGVVTVGDGQDTETLEPEIRVKLSASSISSGDNYNFSGYVVAGASSNPVYCIIENKGDLNLELTGSPIVDIDSTEFIVDTQPSSPVPPYGSTSCMITFTPEDGGKRTATVTILSNDPDEGTFTFTLSGNGIDLAAPELVATPISDTWIDLTWTDNSTDETKFYIERKEEGGDYSTINQVDSNETFYTDTQVTANTKYFYRVRGYRIYSYYGEYSNEANATTFPSWQIEDVDTEGYVGKFPSIALDSNKYPHISYYDSTNYDLKYAKWDGDIWQIESVDTEGAVGQYTSIALDGLDYPHISYYNGPKYAAWDGSNWQIRLADNSGKYTSIALEGGLPHISYYYEFTNFDLKYAAWDGESWQIEPVDTEGDVGQYTSIAIDSSNGYPHISYYDSTNGDLKYAAWDGESWQIESVDTEGDVGQYTSIALDIWDYPHISYYDSTNGDLKYAAWDGDSWQIESVDTEGTVGSYTSIALDAYDYPHISYASYKYNYSPFYYGLKYAKWNGTSWQLQLVDHYYQTTNRRIEGTSIAIDISSGAPHISYYCSVDRNLKYATMNP